MVKSILAGVSKNVQRIEIVYKERMEYKVVLMILNFSIMEKCGKVLPYDPPY